MANTLLICEKGTYSLYYLYVAGLSETSDVAMVDPVVPEVAWMHKLVVEKNTLFRLPKNTFFTGADAIHASRASIANIGWCSSWSGAISIVDLHSRSALYEKTAVHITTL